MFLHIGQGMSVRTREIIGIFDLDTASMSQITRHFLAEAEKDGKIRDCTKGELPKSFVLTGKEKMGKKDGTVCLSQISASSLHIRAGSSKLGDETEHVQ